MILYIEVVLLLINYFRYQSQSHVLKNEDSKRVKKENREELIIKGKLIHDGERKKKRG